LQITAVKRFITSAQEHPSFLPWHHLHGWAVSGKPLRRIHQRQVWQKEGKTLVT
jgi:hypothetical protein